MKKYRSLLLIVLIISFGMNIYLSYKRNKDEYRIGEKSYKNAELINTRNSKNLEILKNAIDSGSIPNSKLLNLYSNYKTIDEALIELINDYSFYRQNIIFNFNKKDVNGLKVLENDICARISTYLENILLNIMNTKKDKLVLEGKSLEDFKVLYDLALNTNKSYLDFTNNYLKDLQGEEKLKKFIDKKYYINVIDNLNTINSEYNDYDFVSEIKVQKLN